MRDRYHHFKARKFVGEVPCIICNNCLGGVIIHDMGLPFKSPTVNTGIRDASQFLYFVNHLVDFYNSDFVELNYDKYDAFAGTMTFESQSVDVVFRHYNSYAEGVSKWKERFQRVDFSNIVVIFESPKVDSWFCEEFQHIDYKKIIISAPNPELESKYDFYQPLDIYQDWFPGKSLEYKSVFSLSRWIDDWDYISFFY